jgi:hypothetical protein
MSPTGSANTDLLTTPIGPTFDGSGRSGSFNRGRASSTEIGSGPEGVAAADFDALDQAAPLESDEVAVDRLDVRTGKPGVTNPLAQFRCGDQSAMSEESQ